MKTLGYYNGHIDEIDRMTVPMNDRACWFGDGVYDAQMARNYKLFALDEHVARFFRSARAVEMEPPLTEEELKALLQDLVRKLDTGNLFVYYQLTRGTGLRRHVYPDGKANLWVQMFPMEVNDGKVPVKTISAEDTRFFHCDIKTINLLPAVMYAERAKRSGCHETILYRPGGRVTECSHCNVHILKGGTLYTAPCDNLILPGIGRAHLLAACRRLGVPVREEPYTMDELRAADEVLLTSSSNLCVRVSELDGAPVGGGDPALFERLRSDILSEFYGETE